MQRYDSYKDSGVQWLGEIPSHWEVGKVKHFYKMSTGFTPPTGKSDYYSDGEKNVWITIGDLNEKIVSESSSHISDAYIRNFKPRLVPSGSLLYSFKLSVGQVAFAGTDLYTNEAIAAFIKTNTVNLGYFYYSAPLFIVKNANTNIYGAHILNQELIKNAIVAFPPLSEQQAIASYLDTATAKIDEAIAQQQKMIDLLNERKQIIINNAVTKGLNPNAKMKPSGIDWIGNIPEHWEAGRLKTIMSIQRGHDLTAEQFQEGSIPVYGSGGRMGYHNCATSKSPSIVIGRSGSVGKLHFVETDFWAHNTAIYLKDNKGNDVKYLFYLLSSINLASLATQTAVPTLDRKNVLDYMFTFTRDINEQKQIVTSVS